MQLPKVIYIMGPPGAGKGTQAKLLAHEIGYEQFSTGDAFRRISRQDTELGQRVKGIIDNGFLMPPEMAAEVVIHAIEDHIQDEKGLIFDGTPRTVPEAGIVDDFFHKIGYGRPLAFYLYVPKETMIERNSKRQFCLDIDGDFPVLTDEDRERCAQLKGRIGIRPDDAVEKFITRWSEYEKQTYPIIDRYLQEGIAYELDGLGSVEKVHQDIMKLVEKIIAE